MESYAAPRWSFVVVSINNKRKFWARMSGNLASDIANFLKATFQCGSVAKVLSDPCDVRFEA